MSEKTTAPVEPTATMPPPEWIRVQQACEWSGISKAGMHKLIREKRFKTVSLRERGAIRGIRLISFDSLKQYIERCAVEPLPAEERRRA